MRLLKILLATVLAAASAAPSYASAGSAAGTGSFANWSGYGYKYTASWDASPVDFALSAAVTEHQSSQFPSQGFFNVSLVLSPVGSLAAFDKLDFTGTIKLTLINATTGLPAVPPGFYDALYTGATASSWITPCSTTVAVSVRFSNPTCSESVTLNGGSPAFPNQPIFKALSNETSASIQSRSGHFLLPSSDPSCASFACMISGHDPLPSFALYLSVGVYAVPEPSPIALLLIGTPAMLFWIRKRRR